MMKKIISLFIILTLLSSTSYMSFAANPQDAITENKLKFQQMNEKIMETNKQISDMNTELDKLNKNISKNNAEINENTKQINAEKVHLEQLVKEVNDSQELANKRIRAMYINGYSENLIALLLTAESFSDFFYKYEAVKRIVSFDKRLLNDLIIKKTTLNENIAKLDAKSQQLQKLKDTNAENLKELKDNKQKLQNLLKQFDQEKNSAAQLIKENEEKLIAHAVSVIDSSTSTISDVRSALQTLNSLYPQLSTDSVKKKAKTYIDSGNSKLAALIANSTKPSDNTGDTYKATYTMTATAYAGGTLTAMGLKPVRDPNNLSTIAVDPKVIPLGTKVYIPGYGYAICSDTGGAIKGNIIDLYMNSVEECYSWGRRTVTLHVIAYPGEW
jgi:3D (Asp-Asp-Asp) domain-containing protein/peptidoglycan hydrolase CwlO-like protein